MGRRAYTKNWLDLTGQKSQATDPTESTVPAGRPRFPKGFPPDSRRVFKDLCRLLSNRRALTEADGESLRLYAILYDRHARALAAVETEGLLITETRFGSNGEPSSRRIKNPHLLIAQESERQMCSILRDLGMTVATRDKSKPVGKPARRKSPEEIADAEFEAMLSMKPTPGVDSAAN